MATKYSVLRIRFHSRQASKNPSLRTGEKTLPNLLIDALEAIFEGEDLIDELGNNAGGDVFDRQGNALGSGRLEGLAGDVFGTLDTAVSKVSSETLATYPADLCRSLVVATSVRVPFLFSSSAHSRVGNNAGSA